MAADKYSTLATLLGVPASHEDRERSPLTLKLAPTKIVDKDAMNEMLGTRYYTPANEHLFEILRAPLREILSDDVNYERVFDRFECLFGLVYADISEKQGGRVRGPLGRFGWKYEKTGGANPLKDLLSEAEQQKESWEPLKAGLFGGDYSRFEQIATLYDKQVSSLQWGW